jgi:hypothetical protein
VKAWGNKIRENIAELNNLPLKEQFFKVKKVAQREGVIHMEKKAREGEERVRKKRLIRIFHRADTLTNTHAHSHTHTYTHAHTQTHTYTHPPTYTHTHLHTHTPGRVDCKSRPCGGGLRNSSEFTW